MPRRTTNVRVSVQENVQAQGWAGTKSVRWTHLRWQKLLSVFPHTGQQSMQDMRAGYGATWRARARAYPPLYDGYRLITLVDNEVEMALEIVKVRRRGRYVDLTLEEKGRQQDGVQGPHADALTDEYEIPGVI